MGGVSYSTRAPNVMLFVNFTPEACMQRSMYTYIYKKATLW